MKLKLYISTLFLAVLTTTACLVDFSADAPEKFSCVTDDDCNSGYQCKPDKDNGNALFCKIFTGEVDEECPDADGDGYGVGKDKIGNCTLCKTQGKCKEDFDDNDEFRYPGAPEICDGKDNDGDGNVDNYDIITCGSANDCPPVDTSVFKGVSMSCLGKKCVAQMKLQACFKGEDPCPCNADPLLCVGGAFPIVDGVCGGPK